MIERMPFSVTAVKPLVRIRKIRLHDAVQYVVFAASAAEAEASVRERHPEGLAVLVVKPMVDDGQALVYALRYTTWTKEEVAAAQGKPPALPKPAREPALSSRPLGETQRSCLESLADPRHGKWPGGWYWNSYSDTQRIMEGLRLRKLVDLRDGKYTINAAGREALTKGR